MIRKMTIAILSFVVAFLLLKEVPGLYSSSFVAGSSTKFKQNNDIDINIDDSLYIVDLVQQNILLFRHKHIKNKKRMNMDYFMGDGRVKEVIYKFPLYGERLDLVLLKTEIAYPLKEYSVFKAMLVSPYLLIGKWKSFTKKDNSCDFKFYVEDSLQISDSLASGFDEYYIAYNEKERNIKFLSGGFYLSQYITDFAPDPLDPESIIPYLHMRLLRYGIEEISYLRKEKRMYFYKVKTKVFNTEIKLNPYDIQNFSSTNNIYDPIEVYELPGEYY